MKEYVYESLVREVKQVELSEQPFILPEDEKPNLLVLKIERVDENE